MPSPEDNPIRDATNSYSSRIPSVEAEHRLSHTDHVSSVPVYIDLSLGRTVEDSSMIGMVRKCEECGRPTTKIRCRCGWIVGGMSPFLALVYQCSVLPSANETAVGYPYPVPPKDPCY